MQQPSSAPSGAHCARHPGIAASLVCGRCGGFMCAECSAGGAQAQCPACRELTGADAFPYRRDDFDFTRLWNHALAAFQRDWLMLTIGAVVFFAFVLGGSLVSNVLNSILLRVLGLAERGQDPVRVMVVSVVTGQLIGIVVSMVVQGVALLGFYRLVMDSLVGRRVELARMFSQLKKLPTYVVAQLVLFVTVWLPSVAYFAVLGLLALRGSGIDFEHFRPADVGRLLDGRAIGIVLLGLLAYLVVFTVVLLPVSVFVVPEIVISDAGALEALRRAWRLGSGLRLECFGYTFVFGLLVFVGLVLCLVPVLPAMALGTCLLLSLFLAARNGSGLPAADHA
ncbi:MAG: hypothetical protein AB1730_24750 [Myxococcota bacterium]